MKRVRWSMMAVLAAVVACSSDDGDRGGGLDGSNNPTQPGDGDGYGDGDGAGDGIGDGDGAGAGDGDGNDGVCEEVGVRATPTTPDMLIVLDRSASMTDGDRWTHSVAAVQSITGQLDGAIRFGLMLFPEYIDCSKAPDPLQCILDTVIGSDGTCAAGKINVPIALDAADDIAGILDTATPDGGTPTSASLDVALTQLTAGSADPDATPAPKFVLLVTDGQPSCPNGMGLSTATSEERQADRELTVASIDKLKEAGVTTYVIGYDTQEFADAMDEFARHGGTDHHRAVENEAELLTEFQQIAGEVVSCSFVLEMEPPDPSYVLVTLDDQQVNLNDENGWTISGRTVTLSGAACDKLRDGTDHKLLAQVLCEVVVPD